MENDTLREIAVRMLIINLNDARYKERYRIFVLLFRLGQFEAAAEHLHENNCEYASAARMTRWDHPPKERPQHCNESAQLLWHCMWAFSLVFDEAKTSNIRLLFSRYKQLLSVGMVDFLMSMHEI